MRVEKRKQKRYALKHTIQAINALNGRSLGVLINISAGGFLLMCGKNGPKCGDLLQLHLRDVEGKSLDVKVGATCVWREEAHATDCYWSGFKFIDISSDTQEIIDNYLNNLD